VLGRADHSVICGLRPPRAIPDKRTYRRFARALGLRRVTDGSAAVEFCPAAVTAGQNCSSRCTLPGGTRDVAATM
jgi:hypothetical protein